VGGESFWNATEARLSVQVVRLLLQHTSLGAGDVGVIAPYRAQAAAILKQLKETSDKVCPEFGVLCQHCCCLLGLRSVSFNQIVLFSHRNPAFRTASPAALTLKHLTQSSVIKLKSPFSLQAAQEVRVATVDAFQGAEREVMIYSCTRTRPGGSFLDSPNRWD
jgi:superfamily I DNA and/or RNA helicase